ncbi:MAG: tRNA pseudouridine(55) synthase TruB [Nitriliruptoraceae bacterium]
MSPRRRRTEGGPEGVLVVDKPAGMTSHDVVDRVRRLAGTTRVGHTGTLDPAATGVLVCCLGRATRLAAPLQAGTKLYAAVVHLGVTTDSDDLDGEVRTRTSAAHLDETTVCGSLGAFRGEQLQVPPMVSAVRVGGERLHEIARRGEEVERAPRRVRIDDLVLDRFTPGETAEVSLLVGCSAGTYIRSLARDLGEALGTGGALASLRRLANGPFLAEDAVPLAALEADPSLLAARLLAVEDAVRAALPVVAVDATTAGRMATGSTPERTGLPAPAAVTAYLHDGRLIAVHGPGRDGAAVRLVWAQPGGAAVTPSSGDPTDPAA